MDEWRKSWEVTDGAVKEGNADTRTLFTVTHLGGVRCIYINMCPLSVRFLKCSCRFSAKIMQNNKSTSPSGVGAPPPSERYWIRTDNSQCYFVRRHLNIA